MEPTSVPSIGRENSGAALERFYRRQSATSIGDPPFELTAARTDVQPCPESGPWTQPAALPPPQNLPPFLPLPPPMPPTQQEPQLQVSAINPKIIN